MMGDVFCLNNLIKFVYCKHNKFVPLIKDARSVTTLRKIQNIVRSEVINTIDLPIENHNKCHLAKCKLAGFPTSTYNMYSINTI